MIESYAFLAAFTAQILAMSVLCPAWCIRYVRAQATSVPAERFAQLYPGVDLGKTLERHLTLYRVLNTGIAVIGLLVLGWLFKYMRRPDWDDGPVEVLVGVYFMAQALPLGLVALFAVRYSKVLKHSFLEGKRTAVLQRRGLFDFVSPFTVFLAVLGYFLFAAYVMYIAQNPFPGFDGYIIMGAVTLVYALNAFCVYWQLYGRKFNPFEPHTGRMRTIGLGVKAGVYSCILCVVYLSLNFTLVRLDLQRWEPFAQSVFFVVCALLSLRGFTAPPRRPEADELGSSPVS
jgi:hypothetical protein